MQYSLRRPIRRKALRHGTEPAPSPASAADAADAAAGRPESRHGHFGRLVERVEGVVGGEVLAGVGAVGVSGVARLHHAPLHVRRLVLGQGRLPPKIHTKRGSVDREEADMQSWDVHKMGQDHKTLTIIQRRIVDYKIEYVFLSSNMCFSTSNVF